MGNGLNQRRSGDRDTSYVVRCFETFYAEIARQKERLLKGRETSLSEGLDMTPGALDTSVAASAQFILNKLYTILDKQALEAGHQGGEFAVEVFQEAQFIMASLADEVFLNINWQGRQYWEDNLLESRLFGTHDAGDLFFQKLESFLADRDPARKNLAEIYLLSLGLGFQGKYRNIDDGGRLAAFRKQLYTFINHRESRLFIGEQRLFPETYTHTLETGKTEHMQDRQAWFMAIAGGFLLLIAFSHFMWHDATDTLYNVINHIQNETMN